MKTSTLTLRPFVPLAVGTDQENMIINEPVAKLVYGGVSIELPPEVIHSLQSAVLSQINSECRNPLMWSILSKGLEEIRLEMAFNLEKHEKCPDEIWFRDNPKKCSFKHPWHPLCVDVLSDFLKRHFDWDKTLKDHSDTKWETHWGKEPEK